MRLTYKGDYALKILLDLALKYKPGATQQELVQIKDISKRQDIPFKYLGQIILTLKGAGYIYSKRGHDGGIFLAKHPGKITLGEIVRLTDGPTSPITCVSNTGPSKCDYSKKCPFKGVWEKVRDSVNEIVDNVTIEDMAIKCKANTKNILDYSI
ncbi:MAG: hypothetical protein A2252_09905 [Elusimicrobia bacterium RIFOXYA2_FULL_39_19]|nr:MAG: hypothetical protein A2252_09905 [Elusimicrobia bacterium RIFOXYA2_FULL_39_19]